VNLSRFSRPTRTATVALASAAVGAALSVPALALATHTGQNVPAPPAAPTRASQIQNIDQVKTAIKAYYGDTATSVNDPVPDTFDYSYQNDSATTQLHQFGADSAYAHETEGIAHHAAKFLTRQAHKKHHGQKAILFDVDDTTLNTYSYEIYSNFVYNPTTNAYFVNAGSADVFPAVPGMVDLEKKAIHEGYTVFFLTGRPKNATTDQKPGTLANLRDAGYDVVDDQVYLKDASGATEPWLSSCAPSCTTIQYKSLTRQYIESLGYDIVANFGDQYSDLSGGFADKTYKIPNPMYYLP
jgi:predicted secreted acid phosphatase